MNTFFLSLTTWAIQVELRRSQKGARNSCSQVGCPRGSRPGAQSYFGGGGGFEARQGPCSGGFEGKQSGPQFWGETRPDSLRFALGHWVVRKLYGAMLRKVRNVLATSSEHCLRRPSCQVLRRTAHLALDDAGDGAGCVHCGSPRGADSDSFSRKGI